MLFLRQAKHLAERLGSTVEQLERITSSVYDYVEQLYLVDPSRPDKHRIVLNVLGDLRILQTRLYRRVLLPKLQPSDQSFGGVSGRHIRSNALTHLGNAYGFTTDISNFYPSISHQRVERLFRQTFQCSPDVSRFCTKICSFDYHLALGLVTSPIIADQIMKPVDARIAGACNSAGLTYTRFVDDIAISGPFDLDERFSGIAELIVKILGENGFHVQRSKHLFGRMADGLAITKLRVKRGHVDVRKEYADELAHQLEMTRRIQSGDPTANEYFSESQIRGRVHFVCWINPGRKFQLFRQYRSIDWNKVHEMAIARGLVAVKKELIPIDGIARKIAPPSILSRASRRGANT